MNNRKVLLVFPGKYGALNPEIPLPLLYLASVLRGNKVKVEIFDMRLEDFQRVDLNCVFLVGITSMTGSMIKYGLEFAQAVRNYNKNIPIVWGGVHPSLLPEETIKSPLVDIVVRNEGELTLLALVKAIEQKKQLSLVQGITFKQGEKVISTPERHFMDLNKIPVELSYDLLHMDKYILSPFPVHTARGCPSRCAFCYNQAYNHGSFRYKTAEKVLDEVEYVIKKFKVSHLSFTWEDNYCPSQESS